MASELVEVIEKNFPFKDVSAKRCIEITIRHDSLVVWINVDGICVSRIVSCGMIPIEIDDRRNKPNPSPHLSESSSL